LKDEQWFYIVLLLTEIAAGTAGTKLKVFLTKVRDDTPKAKVSVHKARLQ